MTSSATRGRRVEIEVVLFHLGETLMHRFVRAALPDGAEPDEVALQIAGATHPDVSHSTSWRTEGDTLVLTYAVLPDPAPASGGQPLSSGIVTSGDPARPRPHDLGWHHVAAHAARHLAYLRSTDPGIAAAARASAHPALWSAIDETAALPVATHDRLAHTRPGPLRHVPSTTGEDVSVEALRR